MFDHKWKQLILKGDIAIRRRSISDARDYYSQAITEADRLLKLSRMPSCKDLGSYENSGTLVSMIVVSHHNMADLWARQGVRVSQTYYLEMAHQKLVDVVRDVRFNDELRASVLQELNRTYAALVSHFKTHSLSEEIPLLQDQYCRIRETFEGVLVSDAQQTRLIH